MKNKKNVNYVIISKINRKMIKNKNRNDYFRMIINFLDISKTIII